MEGARWIRSILRPSGFGLIDLLVLIATVLLILAISLVEFSSYEDRTLRTRTPVATPR